eukprot:TRINITY_DN1049_c0_g2_i12.p1 TRINITY_DN1049_c0_g2~~TRINITY_DN1049_c0_g2_i12.p1  ORF type:complete len:250 (-),score=49.20 TRINITY_DN1049_c0_g2_i12:132-881(-)
MGCMHSDSSEPGDVANRPRSHQRMEQPSRALRNGARQGEAQREISSVIEAQLKEIEERIVSKIIEGSFVGMGIKRTPAYETNLVETEFNEAREKFWKSRTQGNAATWGLLKLACETDEETAAAMVKEHGAVPVNGTLRACYGPSGELYCVPIYAINPPEKYGSSNAISIPENAVEEIIKLKLVHMEKVFPVEVKTTMKGSELKEMLREKLGRPEGTLRLFSVGQEILDNSPLSNYSLSNDFSVISKIIK